MNFFECSVINGTGGSGSKVIVTCDAVFAGTTISCTKGTLVYTQICPSISPYQVTFEGLENGTWTISGSAGGLTSSISVVIQTSAILHEIPIGSSVTPVANVQTWLHCANIWNKSYTTISQVLADASTLQALIASNNAADYMARSTSWASAVTANSSAMTYIGANNYCANKLLADSTWRNAIANSAYIESVLNVKVPTMTSTTQPYGQIVYGSNVGYPLSAFDGIADSSSARHYAYIYTNSYLGYKFVNPVSVSAVRWYTNYDATTSNYNLLTGKIKYSDDGSNWFDAYSITVTPKGGLQKQLYTGYSGTKHQYWAIVPTSVQSDGHFYFNRLQFYGRS